MPELLQEMYYGPNVQNLIESDDCKVMRLSDNSGEGMMTLYHVFPGVFLMYNDFHMKECISGFQTDMDLLCIDHCREGRIEQEVGQNAFSYLEAGDLRVDRRIHHSGKVEFPLCHYHGISIGFQVETAAKEIPASMKGFSVDLYELQKKYCSDRTPYVIPGEPAIEHIFSELYNVPIKIKKDYFKIKVLELLLYLDALELSGHTEERPYFYKGQVEKIKAMDKVEDLEPPLAHVIPELTSNLLLPLAIFVWMLAIDWRMGLSILIAPALAMIPMFFLMKNYNSQYAAYMEANNHVNNIIIEYVEGIEVVKAFNQSTSSYEKFVGAVKSFKDFTLNWFKSTWKTMNLMMAIMPTTLLGVLPVGLLLVRGGSITPAELAMGIILSLSIVGPLMKATTFINEAKSMEYAVEAANELLNLPNLPDSGEFVPINHTDIVLQDVSFSYDGTTQNEVLHGISLNMPQGSFTALVGPSGGGKSTVARLIARFWDVTGGSISIGGKNIKELSIHQLSELVSFVTQDNFLFNCSLKENIRLGNPNATDEEVYAAAKAACCDDFIARLEKGYDTPAGDAGKRLSGGEKQRIAIARAILKNAPIVILDEATAFTDPQNEDKIQKSIMALSKGKTLLVIAHRLSTIQNADQIVVLKKGQIVDCGKQGELLERCPLYADMWQAHIGAKNWSVGEKKEVAGNV